MSESPQQGLGLYTWCVPKPGELPVFLRTDTFIINYPSDCFCGNCYCDTFFLLPSLSPPIVNAGKPKLWGNTLLFAFCGGELDEKINITHVSLLNMKLQPANKNTQQKGKYNSSPFYWGVTCQTTLWIWAVARQPAESCFAWPKNSLTNKPS